MANKKKKILIIRLGAIGDVVHTTIIPKAIKNKYPDYEIHYLTQNEIAPILDNNPYIDKVIPMITKKKKDNKYLLELGCELFKERYDIVFCLTNALRNMLFAAMCLPKQIVLKSADKQSWVENFFNTAKKVFKDIEFPYSLTLGLNRSADEKITEYIEEYPEPYTIIVPGGGTDGNRQGRIWNINNWKKLSDKILSEYGGTVFVCGGKSEKKFHQQLQGDNIVITSGEFNLGESSALLSKADLVISGDTGPAHIASAHGVRVLALLGSTSPDKIKPYGNNGYYISSDYNCKYCWKKKCKLLKAGERYTPCMETLTPEQVFDFVKSNNLL